MTKQSVLMSEQQQIMSCSFSSEASLYMAYMPFVKNGGLFIRTFDNFEPGQPVKLSINLLDEQEPYTIEGHIVWITPKGAQGNKPAGIGVQFMGDHARNICNKIETYLAGMLKSSQHTDTM